MTDRITIVLAATLAVIAFAAAFAFSTGTDAPVACTADARLGAPAGWTWQRDGSNDCAWTLVDAGGHQAPDGVYETAGETPPPVPPGSMSVPVAIAFGALATIIAASAFMRWRRTAHINDP